jgi:predicted PurR-regulated permease PerM
MNPGRRFEIGAGIFVFLIIGVIVGPTLYGFLLAVYRAVKMPTEKDFENA